MRRFRRVAFAVFGLGVGLGLGGCSSSFDPTDWIDFSHKKPLPGERHLVFPEGVPGIPQGVPHDLVKGQESPSADTAATIGEGAGPTGAKALAATEAKPAKAKPAAKTKVASRPKPHRKVVKRATRPSSTPATAASEVKTEPKTASQPAAKPTARTTADDAAWGPAPAQPTNAATGANAPWPATQPAPAPWPSAPPSNQFSH